MLSAEHRANQEAAPQQVLNIWSLSKHRSIKALLFKLERRLGGGVVCIHEEEEEDGHMLDITLHKPQQPAVQAYIYIYGQRFDHYGLHLEFPYDPGSQYQDTTQVYDDYTADQVVTALALHFDIHEHETVC